MCSRLQDGCKSWSQCIQVSIISNSTVKKCNAEKAVCVLNVNIKDFGDTKEKQVHFSKDTITREDVRVAKRLCTQQGGVTYTK